MPAAADRSIQEIFREFVLSIPDYQRGFAWETKQLDDFLEDLDLLAEARTHYTGTLILHPRSDEAGHLEIEDASGTPFRLADVVDGQQRLTTVVILLAAIGRNLRALGQDALADGLATTFIASTTPERQPLVKLRLNHDAISFWERNILAEQPGPDAPSIASHTRLLAAREHIDRYLRSRAEKLGDDYPVWLNRLREKVVKQLRLTVYEVDDEADVGVIFEPQNDRGRPLTNLEKTKNLLLYLASKLDVPNHGLPELINDTWTKILRELNARDLSQAADEDALLRCHWLIFHNPQPRDWLGFETVKSSFSLRLYRSNQPALANRVRDYLVTLSNCVTPYCGVWAPGHSSAFAVWKAQPAVRGTIISYGAKLLRIGAVANLIPLLVACRLNPTLTAEEYLQVLKRAENFSFRTRAARTRSDGGQRILFPLASRVRAGSAGLDDVLKDLRTATESFGSAWMVRLVLGQVEDWYKWPLLKYVLYEYELDRGGPIHPPGMAWEYVEGRRLEQSIEHILPQTPSDPYWRRTFTSSEVESNMNDLGNLCLTYDNSSYRNKAFPDKKGTYTQDSPCYANSPLYQERDLCQLSDWTPESVKARRSTLLDYVWTRWEIAPVGGPGLQSAEAIMPLVVDDEEATGLAE